MTETRRLVLVAKVTDKIGSEGKDVKFTFSTVLGGGGFPVPQLP